MVSVAAVGAAGACRRTPPASALPLAPAPIAADLHAACPQSAAAADSVARTAYYEFQVTRPAQVLDDGFRARPGPTAGEVVAEFVVDTAGRVEPGTLKPLRNADARLVAQVRAILPELRFDPAELARGCRVRQVVQQPFEFH